MRPKLLKRQVEKLHTLEHVRRSAVKLYNEWRNSLLNNTQLNSGIGALRIIATIISDSDIETRLARLEAIASEKSNWVENEKK